LENALKGGGGPREKTVLSIGKGPSKKRNTSERVTGEGASS